MTKRARSEGGVVPAAVLPALDGGGRWHTAAHSPRGWPQDPDPRDLKRLLGALPSWVQFPDFERASWVNSVLVKARIPAPPAGTTARFGLSSGRALCARPRTCRPAS